MERVTPVEHRFRGARALVALHEIHMREFLAWWRHAKAADVRLPAVDDPDYVSLEALLRHVLGCARGYLCWMCDNLGLEDPRIRPVPGVERVEDEADEYLEHLLWRWREPLVDVPEERFYDASYEAPWGALYCVDAMLEHAVLHPTRHTFQLRELLDGKQRRDPAGP